MEVEQSTLEPLPVAIDISHKLRDGGANIATITDALSKAGFSEHIQRIIRTLLPNELEHGYKRPTEYQQKHPYP
jgi:hypothetical protein